MKRRYNHETKQWDIVLTEEQYALLQMRIESLERTLRNMPIPIPIKVVEGAYLHQKCTYPCNCSGACFMNQKNQPIQTWSNNTWSNNFTISRMEIINGN